MSRRDSAFQRPQGWRVSVATTRPICPLDLEHILQYSKTGWCPGCLSEKSQSRSLLKDGSTNKVAVTKTEVLGFTTK